MTTKQLDRLVARIKFADWFYTLTWKTIQTPEGKKALKEFLNGKLIKITTQKENQ